MEKLIFIFLLGIIILLVIICHILIDLHNDLKHINKDIRKAHPKMFIFDNSINDVKWNGKDKF